ncbi:uncharacterized protein V6R79_026350 [Siganus canaliculatus]
MELSSHADLPVIQDSSLKGWKMIGSGGFGQVFRARHCQWGCDVAIKQLRYDDQSSRDLLREIQMTQRGNSPNVIQVLGVFQGRFPSVDQDQLGLVMDFMKRGSLDSLQVALAGPLPWSLVFQLAHQVALGINFLHSLSPAVLHLDLKPSNVLLDSYLNAKLTDFGLARNDRSTSRNSSRSRSGGTYSYMPPEAFSLSYRPTDASDIYSYGILLWSIVTGKEPYANALPSLVRLRIPEGDRPLLKEVRNRAAECQGLDELVSLMERCWDGEPEQRPSAHDCVTETEQLFNVHQETILDAVHEVLKKLDKEKPANLTEHLERVHIDTPDSNKVGAVNYDLPKGPQPNQHPQRQLSSPNISSAGHPAPTHFHISNVTGFQYGSNNVMHVYPPDNRERRRNPSAPSRVNSPKPK